MYGLVNKAFEDLVTTHYGVDAWDAIRVEAGLGDTAFEVRNHYDDELTFKLVGAASEYFMQSADVLLKLFGRHWILYTGREGWLDYFDMDCPGTIGFLEQLNSLHDKIRQDLPGSEPPRIVLIPTSEGYQLEYHSHREGLAPIMEGILEGLAEHYKEPWVVEQTHNKTDHGVNLFSMRLVNSVINDHDAKAA